MTYTRKPCACPLFILMLLTALLALFALLAPGRALAAGATQVQVMGSKLTDDTYYIIDELFNELLPGANENSYNVRFDPATSTLYLKDAKIEYTFSVAISFTGDLTINLSGANEVSVRYSGLCYGISGDRLTITGGGSLVVTSTYTNDLAQFHCTGIASKNLVIDTNTSVTCVAQAPSGATPISAYGIHIDGAVTVNGMLNTSACVANSYSYGVSARGITLGNSGALTGQGTTAAFNLLPTVNSPTARVWQGDTPAQALISAGASPSAAGDYHLRKYAAVGQALTAVALSNTTIAVNETYTHAPTLTPANAANAVFTWSSSNTNVFTVNAQGTQAVLTGVSVGTATLTATSLDGNHTATCQITVVAALPTVRVGNVDVTNGGRWHIDQNGNGTRVEGGGSHNVAYDVQSTTLSLNGVSFSGSFGMSGIDNGAIYASGSITIHLTGTNVVSNSAEYNATTGLLVNTGNLTVTGSGTLSVTASNPTATASSELYGVHVTSGSLTVQTGATLTATAAQVGSELHSRTVGLYTYDIIEVKGTLEGIACAAREGSSGGYSFGVLTAYNITTTAPGKLKGTGGTSTFSYGVYAGNRITGTGELEGTANNATYISQGVYAIGVITIIGKLKGSAGTGSTSSGVWSATRLIIEAGTLEGQAPGGAFQWYPTISNYTNALVWFGDTKAQALANAGASPSTAGDYPLSKYAAIGPGAIGLTLDLHNLTVHVSETGTLAIASIAPNNALNQTFVWESSNEDIVTVTPGSTSRIAGRAVTSPTASATITGVSEGTATITVKTLEDSASATCLVTVNAASTPPKTGDDSPLWLWVTLAGISLLAIGTLYTLGRRTAQRH